MVEKARVGDIRVTCRIIVLERIHNLYITIDCQVDTICHLYSAIVSGVERGGHGEH